MKQDNIIKIFLISLITLVLLSIFGFTYAYFSLEIEGTPKDIVMTTGDLRLEYKDETELSLVDAVPGDSISKVITVKNVGTKNVAYTLYWGDLINTVENFELHVTLSCKSYTNYGETTQAENGTCEDIYRAIPMSDTKTTGTIKSNISIEPNITHEYTITVTFDSKNYEQNYNKNKSFTGKIGIQEFTSAETVNCTYNGELTQGAEYVNGQYTYRYMQEGTASSSGLAWSNITTDGWGVQLTDKTSTEPVTSTLCTTINNKPVVSMSSMFQYSEATTLDLSSFDTSNVTNMTWMFNKSKATKLDLSPLDTSNVTNMDFMLYQSRATNIDLSGFNTSNVTSMVMMLGETSALDLDLRGFDTSKVTNMSSLFYLTSTKNLDLSNLDTSNVIDTSFMFYGSAPTTLDLSSFNTSNVTNMRSMFNGSFVTNIKGINNFDTSKVNNMSCMFCSNRFIETIDISSFDTSSVTNTSSMFNSCINLKTIYASDKFSTDKITTSTNMFSESTKLVGGNGTKYNSSYLDKTYARMDTASTPGYFTAKQ